MFADGNMHRNAGNTTPLLIVVSCSHLPHGMFQQRGIDIYCVCYDEDGDVVYRYTMLALSVHSCASIDATVYSDRIYATDTSVIMHISSSVYGKLIYHHFQLTCLH